MQNPQTHIFVVDDNAAEVQLLAISFQEAGRSVKIDHAVDALSAITRLSELAQAHPSDLPQLVLTDYHLPMDTGIAVIAYIQAHPSLRNIPIVVFSSSLSIEELQLLGGYGVSYWDKPVCFTEYIDMAKRAVAIMDKSAAS